MVYLMGALPRYAIYLSNITISKALLAIPPYPIVSLFLFSHYFTEAGVSSGSQP